MAEMIKVVYATRFSIEHLRKLPSNFSYYLTEIEKDPRFEVHLLKPQNFKGDIFIRTLKMAKYIRAIKPDILYLTLWQGYNNLVIAKILGLISCKIAIWKYTYCKGGSNFITRCFFKKIYWPCIDRIYMMFDNHTEDALKNNLVKESQIVTLSRGVDINWYSRFTKGDRINGFRLVATGKDNRDYLTLCEACDATKTPCEILTINYKPCVEAAEKYKNSKYVHFTFMENGYSLESYNHIVEEVSKSSVMAICCEKLPYGAGYTNIVECLAFKIPILQTLNPDVHLDPEKEGIGYSILPYDVESWKEKITLVKDESIRKKMEDNIQRLLDGEYNSNITTEFIKNDFINLANS